MAQQTNDEDPGKLAGTEPEYRRPYEKGSKLDEAHSSTGKFGIMHAGNYEWDNARCTREAYGDVSLDNLHHRSTTFHTTWMSIPEAVECLDEMPVYGGFRPEHAAAVLESLPASTRVVVGREGSPVIYLWTDNAKTAFSAFSTMTAAESLVDDGEWEEWLTSSDTSPYNPPIRSPNELGGLHAEDVDSYPIKVVGDGIASLELGKRALIRAWYDG